MTATPVKREPTTEMEVPATPTKHKDKRDMILEDIPHSSLREVSLALLLNFIETAGNEAAKLFLKDSLSQHAAEHINDDVVDVIESMVLGTWVPPDKNASVKSKLDFSDCC
jgi:hypothetical protein